MASIADTVSPTNMLSESSSLSSSSTVLSSASTQASKTSETNVEKSFNNLVGSISSPQVQPEWIEMELGDVGKSIFNELPLSKENLNLKIRCLETALVFKDTNLLKLLSTTRNGLINKELRSQVWPELIELAVEEEGTILGSSNSDLGSSSESTKEEAKVTDWDELPKHRDEEQVLKDVDRSFIYFPKNISAEELQSLRTRLNNIIVRMLRTTPLLNYYQGYHDIATIIVLVFDDDETAFKFLNKLTLSYLRDHMLPNIESTVKQLNIIPEVLSKVDHKFYKIIGSIQPLYSLSSVISIFSHDLSKFDDLCLVWDFIFVQNNPCLVMYVYVSILIYYKDDILNDLDELSGKSYSSDDTLIDESTTVHEGEFYNKDFVHVILNNLINNNLNSTNSIDSNLEIFNILQLSLKYLNMYPPDSLDSVNNISRYSVLKDQRLDSSLLSLQITEQAEQLAKEKAENELLYKRQQEQKPKKTTNPPSSPPKKRLNWLTLRNKNLSLLVKLSLSIGLLGIVINYAVQHNSNLSFLRPKLQYIGLNGGSIFSSFNSYNAKGISILANNWCSQAGEFIDQVINGFAKGINNHH